MLHLHLETELKRELERATESFRKEKESFLKDFETNPAYQIQWSEPLLVAQEVYATTYRICNVFTNEELNEDQTFGELLEFLESNIRQSFHDYGSNSTSPIANATKHYEMEGRKRAVQSITNIVRWHLLKTKMDEANYYTEATEKRVEVLSFLVS